MTDTYEALRTPPKVFISYKRDHAATAEVVSELEQSLRTAGMEPLRDIELEVGESWSDQLWNWLLSCSAAIAVVTEEALRSDWCRREHSVLMARHTATDLKLVPVIVGDLSGKHSNILEQIQGVIEPVPSTAAVEAVALLADLVQRPMTPDDYLAAHRAWLHWQYTEAQVLGQEPFALGDVYLDTDCGVLKWEQIKGNDDAGPLDAFTESDETGGREPLLEAVTSLLGDPGFRDMVVVQSPAGGGKSAFTLRLANHLASNGLVPFVVRFRDMRMSTHGDRVDELLQDAMRVAPEDEHPPQPAEPLLSPGQLDVTRAFGSADISQTVIILDGWDEVSLTGSTSYQTQLATLLPKVREFFVNRPGAPVRLVMTGRPSAEVTGSGVLRRTTPVLTIRPLNPSQVSDYAAAIDVHLAAATVPPWRVDFGQWSTACDRYKDWFNDRSSTGLEVLGSPLLALLAMRTIAAADGELEDLFAERTALYHALINETVGHSGKAADVGLEDAVHRGGMKLRRLLQRVATVMTILRQETVSFVELERRLAGDEALDNWATDTGRDDGLHELVVNFYFKSHTDLGCEFLHKSFREYLYAEGVVSLLEELSEGCEASVSSLHLESWQDFPPDSLQRRASRELAELLSAQWLSPEVRAHIFWLIEKGVSERPDQWSAIADLLVDVYAWWFEGVHLRQPMELHEGQRRPGTPPIVDLLRQALPFDRSDSDRPPRVTTLDAHLGDALLAMTARVHELILSADVDLEGRRCRSEAGRFTPFGPFAREILARITAAGWGPLCPFYLAAADLQGAELSYARLRGVVLRGADLTRAALSDVQLRDADLSGAKLLSANLIGANLQSVDLIGASATGADLIGANLINANAGSANLTGANLSGAWLMGASLVNARLSNADLRDADLRDADLGSADLTCANLSNADLSSSNLDGADLSCADLDDTNLSGANLRKARVSEVDIKKANFHGAIFD